MTAGLRFGHDQQVLAVTVACEQIGDAALNRRRGRKAISASGVVPAARKSISSSQAGCVALVLLLASPYLCCDKQRIPRTPWMPQWSLLQLL